MNVSWNWLQDFIDLSGLTPKEVAHKLTMSGMEVEQVEEVGGLDNVVVGRIVDRKDHPESDHLSICTVDGGDEETLQIVCGAPNAATGMTVPLAKIGARLGESFVIKKAKMRGVASFGMLCSSTEIGLDDGVDGLMKLDDGLTPGTPIGDALGLADTVFEIGLTPNRPDGLSIRGVAREIAALYDRPWNEVAVTPLADHETTGTITESVQVEVVDSEGCPRYACVGIKGVRIGPSPEWMQQRLKAVGQRPVNNVVDVTNYILLEQGQPIHSFDLGRVRGSKIIVRRAADGETIESIDHVEHSLVSSDLVICDAEGPVAIAGVMGGADSEISDDTTDVLIECANFHPSVVRKTSQRVKLHTESSHRFERGVDILRIPEVLQRTLDLLLMTQVELGVEAQVVAGILDEYPVPYEAPQITMASDLPTRILGLEIAPETSVSVLQRLGLEAREEGDSVVALVPAFRPDLRRPIDLVEEVGRVVGYNEIPTTPLGGELGLLAVRREDEPPHPQPTQPVLATRRVEAEESVRDCLAELGLMEAVNWAMIEPAKDDLFVEGEVADALKLRNALGDRTALRRSLLPGLIASVEHNVARGNNDVGLFEIGHVFPGGEVLVENPEPLQLGIVLVGQIDEHWSGGGRAVDGFDVGGLIRRAVGSIGTKVEPVTGEIPPWAHPAESARLKLGRKVIGWFGRVHPSVLDAFDLEVPVYAAELDLGVVLEREAPVPKHESIAKTPTSVRDLALVVPSDLQYDQLHRELKQFRHKLLESISLFDVYEGTGLEPGTKSVALRARYRDLSGTLTDKAVEKVHAKLLRHLERAVGATLR